MWVGWEFLVEYVAVLLDLAKTVFLLNTFKMEQFFATLQPTTDFNAAASTREIRARAKAAGILSLRPRKNDTAMKLKAFVEWLSRKGWHRKRVHNKTVYTDLGFADERRYLS